MTSDRAWDDLAAYLRSQRQLARLSLRALAQLTQVSDSYLSQVERGLYQPSPEVLKAIARALQIPVATLYARLGWLDDEDASTGPAEPGDRGAGGRGGAGGVGGGVEAAIERDPRLSATQREALRGMYRALVGDDPASAESA